MDLEATTIREGLKKDIPVSVILLDKVGQALYDGLTKPLGQSIVPGVASSLRVVVGPQHGADSVKGLGDELSSVIGEPIRWGTVRIHLVVEESVGDSGAHGSLEQYEASQSREPVCNKHHELVSTLLLR